MNLKLEALGPAVARSKIVNEIESLPYNGHTGKQGLLGVSEDLLPKSGPSAERFAGKMGSRRNIQVRMAQKSAFGCCEFLEHAGGLPTWQSSLLSRSAILAAFQQSLGRRVD